MNELNKKIDEIQLSLNQFSEGLQSINDIDPQNKTFSLYFDGLTKRFERLFTGSTELLTNALLHEGIDVVSPRQAIREAVRIGWISDPDFWLVALDAKMFSDNDTHHLTISEYKNIFTQFASEAEVIINLIKEINKSS